MEAPIFDTSFENVQNDIFKFVSVTFRRSVQSQNANINWDNYLFWRNNRSKGILMRNHDLKYDNDPEVIFQGRLKIGVSFLGENFIFDIWSPKSEISYCCYFDLAKVSESIAKNVLAPSV